MIVKILIAVLIFGITVIIHELGHFLLAKANGITVTEFSIGFGPTVVKTEKGGTIYSLKLLPFGGACQMLGEDGEEEGEGTFNSKSVWARISVVAAGPVFNMILAFFCAIFVISYAGSSRAKNYKFHTHRKKTSEFLFFPATGTKIQKKHRRKEKSPLFLAHSRYGEQRVLPYARIGWSDCRYHSKGGENDPRYPG